VAEAAQEIAALKRAARGAGARAGSARGRASGRPDIADNGLRLLLSTHLSFPQIAGEMFLSRHTIKSQAMSIYRKLGAPSRSQAVARSRELGLLEG
jgi:LuxR family transcriptional regulator, maltose regulon positive regulatory protein